MEEYYQKVIKLQELLRQSEEERLNLEMKFNESLQLMKQEEEVHMKKFKSKYRKFMDEDRKRQQRNDRILETLDRIENRTTMWETKTEKFKTVRKRYQDYLSNLQEYKNRNLADGNEKKALTDFLPKKEMKPSGKILSQDYEDDALHRKVLDNTEHLKKYSNLGNINSIYSRLPREKSNYGVDLNSTDIKNTKDYANILTQNNDTVARDVALDDYLERPSSTYPYNSYSTDFTSGSKFTSAMDLVKDDDFEENAIKKPQPNSFYESPYLSKVDAPQLTNFPESNEQEGFKPSPLPNLNTYGLECSKTGDKDEIKTQQKGELKSVEERQFINKPFVQNYEDSGNTNVQIPKQDQTSTNEPKQPLSPIVQPRRTGEKMDFSQPYEKEQLRQNSTVLPLDAQLRQLKLVQQNALENASSPSKQYTDVKKWASLVEENKQLLQQELDENKKPLQRPDDYVQPTEHFNGLQQEDGIVQPTQQYVEGEHVEQQDDESGRNLQQQVGGKEQPKQQYYENEQPTEPYEEKGQPFHEQPVEQQFRESEQLLQSQYDANGQPLQQYDSNGQPLQQYDETEQPLEQYDANGQPLQQYDANGQPLQEYDTNGQLLQQYNETEQPLQEYDVNGQPLQQYDEAGQPLQQYDANGQPLQQYDDNGQPLLQYDESGQPLQQYDENGQLLQQYDANGQPLQQFDESGQPLPQYDENGQLLQQYDANGQPLQQYDANGQPLQQYDESGQHLQQYDENGQPLQQYDANGQPLQQYDGSGQPLQQYDADGQLLQQYDEAGQPFQPQYDENGQLIQQYDENGQPLQYDQSGEGYQQYDENGQPIQYDPNGQLYQQYDENGQPIQQYDGSGQLDDSSKPKQNVLDMLETDTESFQQESKISNDSDFDISNTA